jgi:hypothetical protein
MSTADSGDAGVARTALEEAKALVTQAQAEQPEQLELDGVTPEDIADARAELGPNAGGLSVLNRARERKRGRPRGARNKRTDDFARYLLSFGQHPALTMMQIQASDPAVLQENSRRQVTKVLKGGKGEADRLVEVTEETLSYEGAQSLRVRCAEALLPYLESKKPVAIDMSFTGVGNLVIEGVTHTRDEMTELQDAEFMELDDEEGAGG